MALYLATLALLCLASVTCGPAPVTFSKAATDFTLDLLKVLSESPGENVVFSPSSINILLALLQQGADTETAKQLENVLHASMKTSRVGFSALLKSTLDGGDGTTKLKMGTKMFLRPGSKIQEKFQKEAKEIFDTGVDELAADPTAAASAINSWVSDVTDNHISQIIQPSAITPDSVMVLTSAVFFSGNWRHKFSTVRPAVKFFTAPNVSVEVPFLIEVRRLNAGRVPELGFKWVELPYEGDNYSMVLVLPTAEHGLDALLQNLKGDDLMAAIGSSSSKYVRLRMPKFTLKQSTPLQGALIKLGLRDIFSNAADLAGVGPGLYVSSILHEACLEVDEQGSKAAAASGIVINTLSLTWNPDEMKFNANQPFLAFIMDKTNGVPLFAARIANPS